MAPSSRTVAGDLFVAILCALFVATLDLAAATAQQRITNAVAPSDEITTISTHLRGTTVGLLTCGSSFYAV